MSLLQHLDVNDNVIPSGKGPQFNTRPLAHLHMSVIKYFNCKKERKEGGRRKGRKKMKEKGREGGKDRGKNKVKNGEKKGGKKKDEKL